MSMHLDWKRDPVNEAIAEGRQKFDRRAPPISQPTVDFHPLWALMLKLSPRGTIMRYSIFGLLLALTLLASHAMAVEEPAYTTLLHENDFELRNYPSQIVAEVTVTGDQKAAANRGFRALAGYIFGANAHRQSIAMTAPVVQARSDRLPMTAPMLQTEVDGAWIVRFTMPRAYTLQTLPKPNNPDIRLKALPPQTLAVVRFSGLINSAAVDQKSAALRAFIVAHKWREVGPPLLAQYDPPWTLWFMRRNEIAIPVDTAP
jgi:hypothetical protein